jgi:hypothetical protein
MNVTLNTVLLVVVVQTHCAKTHLEAFDAIVASVSKAMQEFAATMLTNVIVVLVLMVAVVTVQFVQMYPELIHVVVRLVPLAMLDSVVLRFKLVNLTNIVSVMLVVFKVNVTANIRVN